MTIISTRLTLPGPIMLAGAGKMGGALLAGWLEHGLDPRQVLVQDPSPPPEVTKLIVDNGIVCAPTIALGDTPLAVLLVAVKPQLMDIVLPSLAPLVSPDTVVLSIAAGRTLAGFAAHLPAGAAIVRSMPNTPASIGRGITVACANAHVTPAQRAICRALLEAVGSFAWVEDESQLDAVTAVSGSGPAYIFLLAEVMAKAGEAVGLPKDLAARLARETVSGAGALLAASDLDAAKLRENVTSPNGTTAAALSVLMAEPGLEDLMRRAIQAATIRGRDLAK